MKRPDLMDCAPPHGVPRDWRHFLFCAEDATLNQLAGAAKHLAPGLQIVGRHAPPYRPMISDEGDAALAEIRVSETDVV